MLLPPTTITPSPSPPCPANRWQEDQEKTTTDTPSHRREKTREKRGKTGENQPKNTQKSNFLCIFQSKKPPKNHPEHPFPPSHFLKPAVMDTMIEAIVEKSEEELKQLKGITATYRMTNKPPPVRHSPYVSTILRPLKVFLGGERASYLTEVAKSELLHGASEKITTRYYEQASELVSNLRKAESSLQRLRQGAQKRTGVTSDSSESNISNTDKICMQLFLDIQEYGRNLAALGVVAADIAAFRSLWECVAPRGREAKISF